MTFEWTKHRFSGGLLALDVANTVVMRHDPMRVSDRLQDPVAFEGFVKSATRFCASELSAIDQQGLPNEADRHALIALRESIDGYARAAVHKDKASGAALARLFETAARASHGARKIDHGRSFALSVAISAMKLLDEKVMRRCKICPSCGWLFLDQSKNQSRLWCDMAVCGNRAKARTHYAKNNGAQAQQAGATK